jgi:elongation factor G
VRRFEFRARQRRAIHERAPHFGPRQHAFAVQPVHRGHQRGVRHFRESREIPRVRWAKYADAEIPEDLQAKAADYRHILIEAAVELDNDVMAAYLDGLEPDAATLRRLLRKAVRDIAFIPILCGAAFKNKGVQPLLDAVVDFLPSPLDREAIRGVDMETGADVVRLPRDEDPFSMLAFKIMDDPFVGTITFARVYSGHVLSGTTVLNSTKDNKERVGRMLLMHANNREDIKEAYSGDIVALAGLKDTRTGDTLCDLNKPVILERMEFPEPVSPPLRYVSQATNV